MDKSQQLQVKIYLFSKNENMIRGEQSQIYYLKSSSINDKKLHVDKI